MPYNLGGENLCSNSLTYFTTTLHSSYCTLLQHFLIPTIYYTYFNFIGATPQHSVANLLDWIENIVVACCPISRAAIRQDARTFVGPPPVPTVAGLIRHYKPQFPNIFINMKQQEVIDVCVSLAQGNWGLEC